MGEAVGSPSGKTSKKVQIKDSGMADGAVESAAKKQRTEEEPEQVRVLHIIRKHKGSRNPSSWRENVITCSETDATATLRGLRAQLAVLGDPGEMRQKFEALAREHSDCGSAQRSGDLGVFGRGKMQKAFEDAS